VPSAKTTSNQKKPTTMQRILAALTAALAFVFGSRENIAGLKTQIADRDAIITTQNATIADLHTQLDAAVAGDAADAAALQASKDAQAQSLAAQQAAETALAQVNADIESAGAKADELAASITADSAIPLKVATDGTVTPA
jgi:hypothetical protein